MRILSIPGEEEPCDPCIIFFGGNVVVIFLGEERAERRRLIDADLEREHSTGVQSRWRGVDQFVDQLVPGGAAKEGDRWIVLDFAGQLRGLA